MSDFQGLYESKHITSYYCENKQDPFDLICVDAVTEYNILVYGYHKEQQINIYFISAAMPKYKQLQKFINNSKYFHKKKYNHSFILMVFCIMGHNWFIFVSN